MSIANINITENISPILKKYPKFMEKYGHLIQEGVLTDEFMKTNPIKTAKNPIIYILDDKKFCDCPINTKNETAPHGYIVKSFANAVAKGKINFKIINCADENGNILSKLINNALKSLSQNIKNTTGINLSLGNEISIAQLKDLNLENINQNILKKLLNNDKETEFLIDNINKLTDLSENNVKVNICATNDSTQVNFYALSKFLTKKPENIKVVGGLNKNGEIIKQFCNYKKIVTNWEKCIGSFLPVTSNDGYKILGWKLEGTNNIALRPQNVKTLEKIKISNKFSGLTKHEAKAKIYKLNKTKNTNYKLKKRDKQFEIDGLDFYIDKNNKLSSYLLYNIKTAGKMPILGTSFSTPISAAKSILGLKPEKTVNELATV